MSTTGSVSGVGKLVGAVAVPPKAPSQASTAVYDSLKDPDLVRFLSAPQTQQTLLTAGLLTPDGRILNTESPGVKGRLRVIEQELVTVAEEEEALKKEEATVRARVRALRIQQLEEERRAKMVAIRQEQAAIREEVNRLTKLLTGGAGVQQWQPPAAPSPSPPAARRAPGAGASLQRPGAAGPPPAATPLRSAGNSTVAGGRSSGGGGAVPIRLALDPVFSTPAAGGAASRGLRGAAPAR